MKTNCIEIEVACTVPELFEFTTTPVNTSKWIPSVEREWVEEDIIQVGTIYHQIVISHPFDRGVRYKVVEMERNHLFALQRVGSDYVCRYTYVSSVDGKGARLVYTEWMLSGDDLEDPMDAQPFQTLKWILEQKGL
jgi:hypothetical protein